MKIVKRPKTARHYSASPIRPGECPISQTRLSKLWLSGHCLEGSVSTIESFRRRRDPLGNLFEQYGTSSRLSTSFGSDTLDCVGSGRWRIRLVSYRARRGARCPRQAIIESTAQRSRRTKDRCSMCQRIQISIKRNRGIAGESRDECLI